MGGAVELDLLEEVGQLGLLRRRPLRLRAGREASHQLHVVPDPQHGDLAQELHHQLAALAGPVQRVPLDAVGLQQRPEKLPHLVQRVVEVGGLLEGGENHEWLLAQAAGGGIPAGELHGRGALALPGVGVQQHDRVGVEGAVQQQEGLVAADEAGVGHVAPQDRVALHRVQLRLVRRQARAGCRRRRQQEHGRGLVDHRHEPVLQRPRLQPHPALGVGGQVLAPLAGGLAEGPPLGQRRIQRADILRGRDHEDAVAHAQHGRDALVDHGLGQ